VLWIDGEYFENTAFNYIITKALLSEMESYRNLGIVVDVRHIPFIHRLTKKRRALWFLNAVTRSRP
jgi:hypothetical protein